MSQFIVLGSYWGGNAMYKHDATCTGRKLPVAEVKQRGLSFSGRTSYAGWREGEDEILAADWRYAWYEVMPGDVITLEIEDWRDEKPEKERITVTVPHGGLPYPPSTLEELQACDQYQYYNLVARGESTVREVVAWKVGGLMMGAKLSSDQCAALLGWLSHYTGVAKEHITVDGDELLVTFRHGMPLAARETLLRKMYQALRHVNSRWYPVRA